jgi:hypothetical protein
MTDRLKLAWVAPPDCGRVTSGDVNTVKSEWIETKMKPLMLASLRRC